MKVVVLLFVLALAAVNCHISDEEFTCDPATPYKENDCNYCNCSPLGKLASCTLMGCQTHSDPKYRDCEVGTSWDKDCNKCWCLAKIGVICSAKKC